MKKFLVALTLLVSACASPKYGFKINTAISEGNNKTIKVVSPDKNVSSTKLKLFFEDILKSNGFKVVADNKKSDYGFVYGINSKSWQSMETIPVYGKTGIRSINTNSYGHLSGNSSSYHTGNLYSSGYYSGTTDTSFQGSYYGSSNTNFEYDYGITGYHNAVINHYNITFTALIMDYKTKDVVYEGILTTAEYNDVDTFAGYVQDLYVKYPMFMNIDIQLFCENINGTNVCNSKRN